MEKNLMSGNEAIAQGAWEAGVAVGVGYPGTPSTETLEALVRKDDVYCEWSPNEKVAFEVGLGAAIAGVRSLVTMKHVGVNVAADPFMAAASTGVNAGLVLLAADDPSCYSSQNEQDSRFYAAFGRIPCLDVADSQDCYEMARAAFELSERFDTPVMLHETMRIAHTRTLVAPSGAREDVAPRDYADDIPKYVMMPANAVKRRVVVDERQAELEAYAETCPFNKVEMRDEKIGVICAGAVYQHVREALPEASTFKLGLAWPLPARALADFAASVDACYVIEEASDYFSSRVRALGIALAEPPAAPLPVAGELKPQLKTLGPKYGKKLKDISAFLASCNAAEVVASVRGSGSYTVDLDGPVVLFEEDLQIFTQSAAGYATAVGGGITVALNTQLSEELLDEGTERELVSKIQTMRKEAGFEVTDRIAVYFTAAGRAEKMLKKGGIAADVLAVSIAEGSAEGFSRTLDVNGDSVTLTLVKAK